MRGKTAGMGVRSCTPQPETRQVGSRGAEADWTSGAGAGFHRRTRLERTLRLAALAVPIMRDAATSSGVLAENVVNSVAGRGGAWERDPLVILASAGSECLGRPQATSPGAGGGPCGREIRVASATEDVAGRRGPSPSRSCPNPRIPTRLRRLRPNPSCRRVPCARCGECIPPGSAERHS